jgi:hypothetical protein
MDDPQVLKRLMTRAADEVGPPFEAPPAAFFGGEPHVRRHGGLSVAAAVLVMLALLVPATLVANSRAHNKSLGTPNPLPTLASVAAASLARYKWSVLPAAPIVSRSSAVGVWTGRELLVWGGASGRNGAVLHADGAAYDPSTRTWSSLPAGPLSPRAQAASVWTGRSVFIWGGYPDADATRATDGALYTPADHSWMRLPPAPVTGYAEVHAFWTGRVIVLLSTPPWDGKGAEEVHAQSYDPATNSWTRLPNLQPPAGHPVSSVVDIGVGNQIYVWSLWSFSTPIDRNSYTTTGGIDSYTFQVDKRRWVPNTLALPDHRVSSTPLWTGHNLVLPATYQFLGAGASGPVRTNVSGVILDPSDASTRPIRHGPVDDLSALYLWTGTALLAFNTGTETSGANGHVYPGRAAAWDPSTNSWTTLPAAPFSASEPVAVWTGKELLIWGQLFTPRGGNPAAATGLEFAP